MTAANLYTCWLCRRISPLKRRPHLMCAYTGYDDPSRDYPEDLSFDGLKAIMPTYSSVVPVCEDEGIPPFTAENQAPAVGTRSFYLVDFCSLIIFLLTSFHLFLCRSTVGTLVCPLSLLTLPTMPLRSRALRLRRLRSRTPATPTPRFLRLEVAISMRVPPRKGLLLLPGRLAGQASPLPLLLPPFLVAALPVLFCWTMMMKTATSPQGPKGVARQAIVRRPRRRSNGASAPRLPRTSCRPRR